jgi:hypothetical protein
LEAKMDGFGMAGMRREGAMIDPDTMGAVESESRRLELQKRYVREAQERAIYEASPAGKLAAMFEPFRRAWRAFFDRDSGA